MSYRRSRFAAAPIAISCLLGALCGCGPGRGTVSGRVTYRDKDVTWGTVSIFASDNMQYSGEIGDDATYAIANVPGGAVKICVSSPNPGRRVFPGGEKANPNRRPDREPFRKPPERWTPIPETYADLHTTPLTGVVNKDTTLDLELK
jgi:hypothetical protein